MKLSGTDIFSKEDKLLVACSGGPDSICLSHILLSESYDIHLAHVNYQLRGNASDEDELFVQNWAEERNIPFHSISFNTMSEMDNRKLSLQECARVLRYEWFDQLARENNYDFILTAHHVDDSIESFFINAFRGTGIKGLNGIPISRDNIIRPLINWRKRDILEYLDKHSLSYRTDSSNLENKYLRNKIRNELIPVINQIDPGGINGIIQTISTLNSQSQLINDSLNSELIKILKSHKNEEVYEFQNDKFDKLRIYHWLESKGFNYGQIEEVCLSQEKNNSGQFWISGDSKILLDRGRIILTSTAEENFEELKLTYPERNEMKIDERIKIRLIDFGSEKVDFDKFYYLDASKLCWPLIACSWEEGDSFSSFGLKGKSKKLSDFFIDLKIPRNQKNQLVILKSEGEIIFVERVGINYHYRIKENTVQALRIEIMS